MHREHVPALEVGGTHVSAALIDSGTWQIVPGTLSRRSLDSHASAATLTGEFLKTFKDFPPSQRAASFTIDQAMEKMKQGIGGQ